MEVSAAVRLTRAYLPGMTRRGRGRIQYIASDWRGRHPGRDDPLRHAETALLAVSRGFAKEAAGTGVTVNSVITGPTPTGGVEDFVYELDDKDPPWTRCSGSSCEETGPGRCRSG
ncbi:hypothetical protein [Streptomyces sp. NRRL S-118]|uniref:hypothetical protein n=1 Tax=Streptomyces sp. NRRL S-118 TaxID=1463881 RepID=UPI003B6399F5